MKMPGTETRYADHMAGLEGDDLHMVFFTWPRALLGRYDIFHLHWPEQFVSNRGHILGFASRVRTWMLLTRLRLFRTPVVRTLHNLTPHDDSTTASRRYQRIAEAFDRITLADAHLVFEPELNRPQPWVFIPHGHYRRPFEMHAKADILPGRLLYFGLIKEYKGVETLLGVFSSVEDDVSSLRIVGKPVDDELATLIANACADDVRISSELAFVSDEQLVTEITAAMLVVLPYREMHSSGAVLVALSLGRPVLVPDSSTGRSLQAEAGSEWVFTFQSPLTVARLVEVMREVGERPTLDPPALLERDWEVVRARHRDLYSRFVTLGEAGETA